jgi:hypothetical protein
MKHTIASLSAVVAQQAAQIAHLTQELEALKLSAAKTAAIAPSVSDPAPNLTLAEIAEIARAASKGSFLYSFKDYASAFFAGKKLATEHSVATFVRGRSLYAS